MSYCLALFEEGADKAFRESNAATYVAGLRVSQHLRVWLAFAAVVLSAFHVGRGGGWISREGLSPSDLMGIPAVAQKAIENSVVHIEDSDHPLKLTSVRQSPLVHWLSARLQTDVSFKEIGRAHV